MHIIEEMVLFRASQPVQHIELDTEKVRWSAERGNRFSLFLQSFLMVQTNNKLSKCVYWQFRDSMSHEESQPKADLVYTELITCNFLSGDLQTAGIVALPESWLVFDTLLRFIHSGKQIPIKLVFKKS